MLPRVAIVCLLALVAAGCDRQSATPGQAQPNTVSPDEAQGPPAPARAGVDRSHKGEPMPAASFKAPDSKSTSLAALRGKPLLVNLWATWCGPCVAELPTLDRLARRGTIQVASISQDTGAAAQVPVFLKSHGAATLPAYVDDTMALSLAYGANLPMTILFDSQGREVWRWSGGNDWDSTAAGALIDEAS